MKRATLLLAFALLAAAPAHAQKPAVYAITGAKIYTLAGAPIENGTVILRDGKIAAVGANVQVPAGAEVIDAKGLQVYPGLFDSYSRLGLTEIGAVSATVDTSELNQYNPHLNAYTAVHPASDHIPSSVPPLKSSDAKVAAGGVSGVTVRLTVAVSLSAPSLTV